MIKDIKAIFACAVAGRFQDLIAIRLFKIAIVGTSSFLVQATLFEIFGLQLGIFRPATAAVLAAECAIMFNFIFNNYFSFTDRRLTASWATALKFFKFNLGFVVSLTIQWSAVRLGEFLSNGDFMIVRGFNILGALVGFCFNYMVYTKFIWKTSVSHRKTD